jgi:hypothetical protein
MPPCDGPLIRAHLVKQQVLTRGGVLDPWDYRLWVPASGGPQGNGGHHGMLDHSRTLRVPREALPGALEELAVELGFGWWLDREYGPR